MQLSLCNHKKIKIANYFSRDFGNKWNPKDYVDADKKNHKANEDCHSSRLIRIDLTGDIRQEMSN